MAKSSEKKKCEAIFHIFCICFIKDLKQEDILLLEEFVQIYKNPNFTSLSFQVLDERSVRIVAEFFRLYGEKVKNTEIKKCTKIAGKYCVCFIKDIKPEDISLLENTLKLNQEPEFQSFTYQIVKDREIRIISHFYSIYGLKINKDNELKNFEYLPMSE